jgi:acetyltransferase-like isoleucine patch superfamily enzyme
MSRETAKAVLRVILAPRVWLYRLHYAVLGRLIGTDRAFQLVAESLSVRRGLSGIVLRERFYRAVLPACGARCTFHFGVTLTKPSIRLGSDVALGNGTIISAAVLGSHVLAGPGVILLSGKNQHGHARRDIPMSQQPGTFKTIHVGDDCWIGARAIILEDLGKGVIVAAGAVVIEPVPDYAIVGGNPARVLGTRRAREER